MPPKPAMKRIGVFSEPSYTTIDDPFEKPGAKGGSKVAHQPQITASAPKSGKTWKGCLFSKPGRLFEGDVYRTRHEIELAGRPKLKADQAAWRPSSGTKKHSGSGDFYGTVGGKTPYIPQGGSEAKKTKDNVVRQLPNMVTNPCKKGTYGVFGTYLGYKKGYKGASGEFEYISDPIREPERKRATTADAPPAFKPPPSRSSAFGKIEYVPLGPRPATARKAGGDDKAPFNPGGATFVKMLNKPLPAPYIEDPYEAKQLLAKKELQEHLKKVAGRPGFVAMGTTPSSVTRSIFKMNIRV